MPSVPRSLQQKPKPPSAFAALIAVERKLDNESKGQTESDIKVELFQSLAPPWKPELGQDAFGGHVFAQSAYAASKTVPKQFVIHVSASSLLIIQP